MKDIICRYLIFANFRQIDKNNDVENNSKKKKVYTEYFFILHVCTYIHMCILNGTFTILVPGNNVVIYELVVLLLLQNIRKNIFLFCFFFKLFYLCQFTWRYSNVMFIYLILFASIMDFWGWLKPKQNSFTIIFS